MTKPKEATCVYNTNRSSYKNACPYCVWKPVDEIIPPHIGYTTYDSVVCRKCKAYKNINDIDAEIISDEVFTDNSKNDIMVILYCVSICILSTIALFIINFKIDIILFPIVSSVYVVVFYFFARYKLNKEQSCQKL